LKVTKEREDRTKTIYGFIRQERSIMVSSKIPYRLLVIALLFSLIVTTIPPAAHAQGPDGSQLQFTGTVEDMDGSVITVSGLQVDISLITITVEDLAVGMTVTVTGTFEENVVVAAVVIIIATGPDQPDSPSDGSPPDGSPPDGDSEEVPPDGSIPGDDSDGSENDPVIVIEGPVQSININIITIFNIDIEIDPADPILTELHIGDYVRIAGDTHFEGGTVVVIAVNVVIVNVVIVIDGGWLPSNCKRTKKGKITCKRSHKRT
jgi:hypothetical protein